jgi:hypothetical protein
MSDNDIVCDLVIDYVVELLGRRYRKSQIRLALAKEINGGKPLDIWVFNHLMKKAKQKIRSLYGIDPLEYKGQAIEWLESQLRDDNVALKYKLRVHEQLLDLLGLKHISTDDPSVYAEKVAEALRAMDDSVQGNNPDAPSQESIPDSKNESKVDVEDSEDEKKLKEALKIVELTDDGLSLKSK